jgi:hypothetical protein
LLLLLSGAPALAQPVPQPAPLTGEILISVSDATSRLRPGVAAERGGRFVVVWREVDGQDGGIAARRVSASGAPLGTGFVVAPPEEGRHTTDPQVACPAGGGILAAWGEAAFLRPGCAKGWFLGPGDREGETFELGSCPNETNENGRAPRVALAGLPDGRFTAAWEEGLAMTTAGTDVVVRSFASPGEPLSAALRVDGEGAARDAAGRSVVLWLDERSAALLGRRFDAEGRPLGARFVVTGDESGFPVETAVAAAPSGRFVAVWSAFDGSGTAGTRIFAQRFDAAGRKRGAPIAVSPADSPSHRHRAPDVAMDGNGSFAVVWDADRSDSDGTAVLGRFYDRDGVPRGPAFRVNTTGRGSQGHPAVAFAAGAAGAKTFLVVWDSQKDAAARGSIAGRLYSAAQPVVP